MFTFILETCRQRQKGF
jgi:hypothetical protein